jgi:hypothetical protein
MRKRLLIIGLIFILLISTISILWHVYDLSSDYNYATAKLDIKNGNIKIINVGIPKVSSKDQEIEMVANRYGFKNTYIEKYTPHQTEQGIKNYNDLIETYLTLRNGPNWKTSYKREVDSLYKIAADPNN